MTRDQLAAELSEMGLSATEKALILRLADEYAAGLIDEHASTPRSQRDSQRRAS